MIPFTVLSLIVILNPVAFGNQPSPCDLGFSYPSSVVEIAAALKIPDNGLVFRSSDLPDGSHLNVGVTVSPSGRLEMAFDQVSEVGTLVGGFVASSGNSDVRVRRGSKPGDFQLESTHRYTRHDSRELVDFEFSKAKVTVLVRGNQITEFRCHLSRGLVWKNVSSGPVGIHPLQKGTSGS